MFVDCQNFAASWECYFVVNWFDATDLECNLIHYFVKCSWGREIVDKGKSHEQRWFHSIIYKNKSFLYSVFCIQRYIDIFYCEPLMIGYLTIFHWKYCKLQRNTLNKWFTYILKDIRVQKFCRFVCFVCKLFIVPQDL